MYIFSCSEFSVSVYQKRLSLFTDFRSNVGQSTLFWSYYRLTNEENTMLRPSLTSNFSGWWGQVQISVEWTQSFPRLVVKNHRPWDGFESMTPRYGIEYANHYYPDFQKRVLVIYRLVLHILFVLGFDFSTEKHCYCKINKAPQREKNSSTN